ncbi:hypothetical protein EGW08_013598, partial [Elysia chlorotica]
RLTADGEENEDQGRVSHPVLRTSSLKQEGYLSRRGWGHNSRWSEGISSTSCSVSSPNRRSSLDDLRTVDGSQLECPHSIEALKLSFLGRGAGETTNVAFAMDTQPAGEGTGEEPRSPRPKGNLDKDTLALIRDIGSARLMSPTNSSPPTEIGLDGEDSLPETFSNMVRYFVRKIEQQQPPEPTEPAEPRAAALESPTEVLVSGLATRKGLCARDEVHVETQVKPRPPPLVQEDAHTKTLVILPSSSDQRCHGDSIQGETTAFALPALTSDTSGQTCEISKDCCGKPRQMKAEPGLSEHDLSTGVDGSTGQCSEEENSPTVKHLVGRFESGHTSEVPGGAVHVQESNQPKPARSLPEPCVGSPPAKNISSTSLSPPTSSSPISSSVLGSTVPSSSSPDVTQGSLSLTPPAHPQKRNMPDCAIPVEIVELGGTTPPLHGPIQKRMATSPQTSPPSLARSFGPQPFCRQSLSGQPGETRSWRPVRPKSANDQTGQRCHHRIGSDDLDHPAGQGNAWLHHQHQTGSVELDQGCRGSEGAVRNVKDSEVTFRPGTGEECRKKRKIHGKSLPIPATFRVGEQQQNEQQQQQQRPKLGQGPFYSSM